MEKRQAVILLVLVLVVSLASFTLGVIVGRRGAERDLAHKLQQTERVLVAQSPDSVVEPVPVPTAEKVTGEKPVESGAEETELSFYDNLAKETAPLGSGINLAPAEEPEAVATVQPPVDLPDQPIVKKATEDLAAVAVEGSAPSEAVVAVPEKSSAEMPQVAPGGSHAVQIGSFGAAGDAIALKKKMLAKDYPAFVMEADLGKKGLWYRVRIGPYENSAVAKSVQELLEEKEQVKGFVSRQ